MARSRKPPYEGGSQVSTAGTGGIVTDHPALDVVRQVAGEAIVASALDQHELRAEDVLGQIAVDVQRAREQQAGS
jgi:hypothetical protein